MFRFPRKLEELRAMSCPECGGPLQSANVDLVSLSGPVAGAMEYDFTTACEAGHVSYLGLLLVAADL